MKARRRASRGFGLIEAMVALVILGFGLLGVSRMQSRMVAGSSEAHQRSSAQQLGEELLATALVDVAANRACYTLPASGVCGVSAARSRTNDWGTRVGTALPAGAATSTLAGDQLRVRITWTGRESGDTRVLELTTDAR